MRNARTQIAVVAVLALVGLATVVAGAGAAAQAAPVNTAPPTISGTPTVGQTLTAANGTWSNTPTSYDYQWLRCNATGGSCVNVANGTQKTYTLVGADANHTMRVKVTATNADGSSSAQSGADRSGRSGVGRRGAAEHRPAGDLGHARGRRDADGRRRHLDRQPDVVLVPVAALRR